MKSRNKGKKLGHKYILYLIVIDFVKLPNNYTD